MRQALEMALEWIEKQPEETPDSKYDVDTRYVVIREIEAALAQPDQDEVDIRSRLYQRIHELETQLAQSEQEYGVVAGVGKGVEIPAGVKYYYIEPKLPPQRKPLTDEQMWVLWNSQGDDAMEQQVAIAFAREIEAAHNIKE